MGRVSAVGRAPWLPPRAGSGAASTARWARLSVPRREACHTASDGVRIPRRRVGGRGGMVGRGVTGSSSGTRAGLAEGRPSGRPGRPPVDEFQCRREDAMAVGKGRTMARSTAVVIRDARPEDASGIARVHVATWRTTYRGVLPGSLLDGLDEEHRREWWDGLLSGDADPEMVVLVAEAQGVVVGFASGGPPAAPVAGYERELWALYVLAVWQGRGIGRRLVGTLAAGITATGASSLAVWVLAGNPAERFYAALGGREVARRTERIGGFPVEEVAYGWRDCSCLLLPQG